ncbi:MAG: type II toxin-antitoxin system RelE/ParE family toxin [Gammaproteobacteria bacterium]|nr:type II toxin-antitoxin system RelE/ParE family toxin [Gammaproteobacteria bacterium]
MKLRFTYRAAADLQRLRAFIANDNPLAASKGRCAEALYPNAVDQSQIGREIDEASGTRQWIAGEYVVRYFIDDQILTVNRIWHGKEARPE